MLLLELAVLALTISLACSTSWLCTTWCGLGRGRSVTAESSTGNAIPLATMQPSRQMSMGFGEIGESRAHLVGTVRTSLENEQLEVAVDPHVFKELPPAFNSSSKSIAPLETSPNFLSHVRKSIGSEQVTWLQLPATDKFAVVYQEITHKPSTFRRLAYQAIFTLQHRRDDEALISELAVLVLTRANKTSSPTLEWINKRERVRGNPTPPEAPAAFRKPDVYFGLFTADRALLNGSSDANLMHAWDQMVPNLKPLLPSGQDFQLAVMRMEEETFRTENYLIIFLPRADDVHLL